MTSLLPYGTTAGNRRDFKKSTPKRETKGGSVPGEEEEDEDYSSPF